ncbi:MAG TPA: aldehyde ferredoxin oxidoreductase family protein [Anaerolineae bacterium]|nr:aldehyde ferredoxin oxidoreductase family protein [Anaerolineae bacterium]
MPYVYTGKLLRVDLSTGGHQVDPIPDDDVRHYLLGSGLAAKLFYQEMDPALDPLDPASPLYAFNGLLTGTFSPTGCRSSWCGRSPLTGIWNEANMGGHWGAELRFAGFDGVVVTGQSPEPVYLWIHDGEVEIRPAAHLWGSDHYDTFEQLRQETDSKAQMGIIGQAGENLVRLAAIMQGGQEHARAAGRGGMGALMGSKRLKAIVARGKDKPAYPDVKAFREFVRDINAYIKDNGTAGLSLLGTAGGVPATEKFGDLPLKNWTLGSWDRADAISGQRMAETIFERHTHCWACPIGCGKNMHIQDGPYAGVRGHGPEYETLAGFGGNCLCDDVNAIAYVNDLCNRYGLDTISTSGAIAFAMEAYEKGLIDDEDTGGIDLAWGSADAIIAAVEGIARREGIGVLLADGVRAAARRISPQAEAFALHVKGLEPAYHDPRAFVSMAANYATAVRGACHLEALTYWIGYGTRYPGWYDPEEWDRLDSTGKGKVAYDFQNYMAAYNPLGICKFIAKGSVTPQNVADLVNVALDWGWSAGDVLDTGERLHNLKRLINHRLGMTRADDTLPHRFLHEPRPTGSAAGVVPDLDLMLDDLYTLRGWTPDGIPGPERIAQLGLVDLTGT